jgi:hypothetical protein
MIKSFGPVFGAGAAMALLLAGAAANAYPALPVGASLTFQGTGSAPKGSFSSVAPAGWTGGNGLIFVDSNANFNESAASGVYLTTYGNPNTTGFGTINYVEADGNPTYESGFNYQISGLTPGQTYTLSFYQGASSQAGFGYNPVTGTYTGTTNQWIVALGAQGLNICYNCGGYNATYGQTSTYYDNDPNASIAASQLMTVPYQGTVGFEYVSVNLKADASTQLLSFLAWGDDGSTVNLPPIAFLTGVNAPPGLGGGVPEPAAWTMMILGVFGMGSLIRRQRASRLASVRPA